MDEIQYSHRENSNGVVAICGFAFAVVGIILLMVKKRLGFGVAALGTIIAVVFTFRMEIFIIGEPPRFDTEGFYLFLALTLLPALLMLPQFLSAVKKGVIFPKAGSEK